MCIWICAVVLVITCVYIPTHTHSYPHSHSHLPTHPSITGGHVLPAAAVVLAVGHSARSMYRHLADLGVALTPKPFAMGFRIEHPQELLNTIQYGAEDAQGGWVCWMVDDFWEYICMLVV